MEKNYLMSGIAMLGDQLLFQISTYLFHAIYLTDVWPLPTATAYITAVPVYMRQWSYYVGVTVEITHACRCGTDVCGIVVSRVYMLSL